MEGEAFEAAFKVSRALKRLGVDHHIGGSLASSIHGFPRATLDADLVADLHPGQGRSLRALLGRGFYAEPAAIEDAIRRKRCFNVIFLKTMTSRRAPGERWTGPPYLREELPPT